MRKSKVLLLAVVVITAGCLTPPTRSDSASPPSSAPACDEEEGSPGHQENRSDDRYVKFHAGNEEDYPVCLQVRVDGELVFRRRLDAPSHENYDSTKDFRVSASEIRVDASLANGSREASGTFQLDDETYFVVTAIDGNLTVRKYDEQPQFM